MKMTKTKIRTLTACILAITAISVSETAIQESSPGPVFLSPEKVIELARSKSLAVKASALAVKSQEKTVQSTLSSFLPTISANGTATHLIDKVTLGSGASSSGSSSTIDSILYLIDTTTGKPVIDPVTQMKVPKPPIDYGDLITMQVLGMQSAEFAKMFSSTPDNIYNVGVSIAQPIFTGGKLINGYRIAKATTKAQKESYNRTVADIGFAAEQMYWGYVTAVKGYDAIQETREWLDKLVSDIQKLYDNGMVIELDLLNTKLQLDNFKLTERRTRDAITTVGSQMLLFLGLPSGSTIEIDTSDLAKALPPFTAPTEDDINNILDKREDLKALNCQIDAINGLKKIQKSTYIPMVNAFASIGYTNQYSQKESDLKRNSAVGLAANWTIFDWGKSWRDVQKTDIQIQGMKLQYDNLRSQIRLRILDLSRNIEQSRNALDIAKEDMETAAKALNVARIKYDAQAITNTELLNSRNQLTSKIVAFTQARINAILAMDEYSILPMNMTSASASGGR